MTFTSNMCSSVTVGQPSAIDTSNVYDRLGVAFSDAVTVARSFLCCSSVCGRYSGCTSAWVILLRAIFASDSSHVAQKQRGAASLARAVLPRGKGSTGGINLKICTVHDALCHASGASSLLFQFMSCAVCRYVRRKCTFSPHEEEGICRWLFANKMYTADSRPLCQLPFDSVYIVKISVNLHAA